MNKYQLILIFILSNIEEFKNFVRNNPKLINYVKEGKNTWQEFYELYDLYKDDSSVWSKYLKMDASDDKSGILEQIVTYFKNVDVNKLQEGISSIQKAIDLFGGMLSKDTSTNEGSSSYRPRPVYRRFED